MAAGVDLHACSHSMHERPGSRAARANEPYSSCYVVKHSSGTLAGAQESSERCCLMQGGAGLGCQPMPIAHCQNVS